MRRPWETNTKRLKQKLSWTSVHVYTCAFVHGGGGAGEGVSLRSGKNSGKVCGKVEGAGRIEYLNYVLAYLPESLETISLCRSSISTVKVDREQKHQAPWKPRGEQLMKTGAGCPPAWSQGVTPQLLLPVESQGIKNHGVYFFMII